MEKAARAKLLRERFRAKCGAFAYVIKRVPKRPYVHAKHWDGAVMYPRGNQTPRVLAVWMTVPAIDPATLLVPKTKRRQGVPALTRIAQQLPAKLPIVPLPQ